MAARTAESEPTPRPLLEELVRVAVVLAEHAMLGGAGRRTSTSFKVIVTSSATGILNLVG